jgi:hypothetical protein
MKRISFTSLVGKLQIMALRFPVTLLLLAGVAGSMFWLINDHDADIPYRWWIFCIVGTVISLTAALGTENTGNRLLQCGVPAVSVLLWGLYCMLLPPDKGFHTDEYLQAGIAGAVFSAAVFFISFLKKDQDTAFWAFSKEIILQGCTAFIFGCIFYAGLSLAVYSLDILFGINIKNKVYENLAVICYVLFLPVYFLANIPDKTAKYSEEISFYKIFRILGLYILTPVLGIYTLILYAYLARIIIVWELPNGWVSTLVSTLAVGGLLLLVILYPAYRKKENRVAVLLSRYLGLLLLPLLALMTVGIFRRIGDYGLTINRCYVLVLNVWFYAIFIYLSVTRSKHIKWILISPAVILLLVSFGPWRITQITRIDLQNRLKTHLSQLDFLKNSKISLSASPAFFLNVDDKEKEKIGETMGYLANTYGMEVLQPFFEEDVSNKSWYETVNGLNLSLKPFSSSSLFSSVQVTSICFQNTADYTSFVPVKFNKWEKDPDVSFQNDSLYYKNTADKRSFSIPIKETALLLQGGQEKISLPFSPENKACVVQEDNYLLLISRISGRLYPEKGDSVQIDSFEGYLFYK